MLFSDSLGPYGNRILNYRHSFPFGCFKRLSQCNYVYRRQHRLNYRRDQAFSIDCNRAADKACFLPFFSPEGSDYSSQGKVTGVDPDDVYRIMTYVLLYSVVLVFSAFIFMLYGINSADAIFETSSALATAGLSTGITDPGMPALLKLVLCADMLLGRVEIVPLFILFLPRTWFERSSKTGERKVRKDIA